MWPRLSVESDGALAIEVMVAQDGPARPCSRLGLGSGVRVRARVRVRVRTRVRVRFRVRLELEQVHR